MPVLAADVAQNRLAQDEGVLTALRATAAENAILFAPGPIGAKEWLDAAEPFPPTNWRAHRILVSCDGTIGVATGSISWDDHPGYYTTIWRYETPGDDSARGKWRWILSHGAGVDEPRPAPAAPQVEAASCDALPEPLVNIARMGHSADASLRYRWSFDEEAGKKLTVELWDGAAYRLVLEDSLAPGQEQ
ncbi:hypothetical protein [uncultured Erythrobacter sp.]|uniref:hypothetical protein n=1 Tax=uncultured Erythrobacter sp. TaxID=263913 RepID=UPI00260FE4D5|nr:hypothetical protein [uncultured Erythrobacter sp.]